MEHLDTFGGRVAALRNLVPGLAMRELDSLAGLHAGHCWQIERGNRENPTRDTVRPLAAVFGVTSGFLLEGEAPFIAARPDLDPSRPEHLPDITAHVTAAVERARAQRVELPACELVPDHDSRPVLSTGTEG